MIVELEMHDWVRVTLSAAGAEIWNSSGANSKSSEGSLLKLQLWKLFQVFGGHFGFDEEPPFAQITVVEEKEDFGL